MGALEVSVADGKRELHTRKIIFPVSFDPWKQGILGLGDVVMPGTVRGGLVMLWSM